MKPFFVFLMAVALALPLATAFNCTQLNDEEYNVCNYIENTDWLQSEKDIVIQDVLDSGDASLDGNFDSILEKPVEDTIQLNQLEDVDFQINEENKEFLIDFSSISIFGYVIYGFLKKHYLLLRFL